MTKQPSIENNRELIIVLPNQGNNKEYESRGVRTSQGDQNESRGVRMSQGNQNESEGVRWLGCHSQVSLDQVRLLG